MPLRPDAIIFDAYGTLFDVHSVVTHAGQDITGDLPALSALWRQKQLEYTWLRSLMERYEDFWDVTAAALRTALRQLNIAATASQIDALMQAYLSPSVFPDVVPTLQSTNGIPLAILSNGSPKMLDAAVRHNSVASYFEDLISVDRVKTYKPSPRVYALGPEVLNIPAERILFISSNAWDAAGAKAFGYQVGWCNRAGTPAEDLGFAPDRTASRLDQLPTGG
jgi:2-haloacid dehalogenase